jgi:glycosyltransferase involved in cell wall biosynthesis
MLVAVTMIANKTLFFKPRLSGEIETIKLAHNIIGRTNWDRAHAYAINSGASYYSCNRILRDSFYQRCWHLKRKQRHSLFIGNSLSARKGAHFALHAVAQLKREYPDIKLYIAGESPFRTSWRQWKKQVGYSAYLRHLVKELDLEQQVEFTGILQADAMAERISSVHVYVLCSTIENSPNTLGEAMIMGVPSVAAYVGGASDMANDEVEALFYRDNDPKFLAYQIKRIFDDDRLALKLSENARKRALKTHDPQRNLQSLLAAYRAIYGSVSLSTLAQG